MSLPSGSVGHGYPLCRARSIGVSPSSFGRGRCGFSPHRFSHRLSGWFPFHTTCHCARELVHGMTPLCVQLVNPEAPQSLQCPRKAVGFPVGEPACMDRAADLHCRADPIAPQPRACFADMDLRPCVRSLLADAAAFVAKRRLVEPLERQELLRCFPRDFLHAAEEFAERVVQELSVDRVQSSPQSVSVPARYGTCSGVGCSLVPIAAMKASRFTPCPWSHRPPRRGGGSSRVSVSTRANWCSSARPV